MGRRYKGRKKNNKTKAWIIISVVVVLIVCAVVIIAALFGQRVSENKEADGDGTESGLDRTGSVENAAAGTPGGKYRCVNYP